MKKFLHHSLPFILIILMASFGGGIAGSFFWNNYQKPNLSNQLPQANETRSIIKQKTFIEESSVIDAVKKISPAVVSVIISKDLPIFHSQSFPLFDNPFNDPFSNLPNFRLESPYQNYNNKIPQQEETKKERRKIGGGSGFIYTPDGLVVTNQHVVLDPEADYTVILADGAEYSAKVKSRDSLNDLAILQIENKDGKPLPNFPIVYLGDSDQLQVGQKVVAIGYALAEYQSTVTVGVISALGREITAGDMTGNFQETLSGLLQTDAAINAGNSGGPLINLAGEVIGINTALANGAQGIGFAIPVNDLKSALESVKKFGRIIRPILGVRYLILTKAKAKELQLDVDYGALLIGDETNGEPAIIPGSAANEADLQAKDVILEVENKKITLKNSLQKAIGSHLPGDEIKLKIWRDGKTFEVKVKLKEKSEQEK